jgi:2-C-methyl-D-erythritol 4-phosphate cytidylyltransferase/2-C-methyl-D-erythritol 2,4-cyclodiphosphate synthase
MMRVFCGILASGSSQRYSSKKYPKQLETLSGSALFTVTLKSAKASGLFQCITVSILDEYETAFLDSINNELEGDIENIHITSGGDTRMKSILKIIDKFKKLYTINIDDIFVLCDANRPLVSKELYSSLITNAIEHKISSPSRPLVDGVAIVQNGFITDIPDKSSMHSIQTPEACNFQELIGLIKKNKHKNKLGLSEIFLGAGINPKVVESDNRTYKVTYPGDVNILEALMDTYDE